MEGDVYLQPRNQIRPLFLKNLYTVCNELQTYERINKNNKKLKELDEMIGIQQHASCIFRCAGIGIGAQLAL
jgi:hypothetical protein